MDDYFLSGPDRSTLYNVLNKVKPLYRAHKWKDLKEIPKELKSNQKGQARIIGAANIPMLVPAQYLKTMTDPYHRHTREDFNECVYSDPILAPAIDRRHDALFEDGFTLDLELKSDYDDKGHLLSDTDKQTLLASHEITYLQHLTKIRNWAIKNNLKARMQEANITSLVQGRAVMIITPGITELMTGTLPAGMQIIHWEDLSAPIVDIGLTQRIVALNVTYNDKHILRPDEMVYLVRKDYGLRRESLQYGASSLEAVVAISKLIKRIYHFDIPDAVISSYLTRLIFKFNIGSPEDADIRTKMQDFLSEMTTPGKTVFGISSGIEEVIPVEIKANAALMKESEMLLAERLMSIIGIPKSMLNRQQNLNRDLATMEYVQFIKGVRKPDERLLSQAFEEQLLNPLLASLAGVQLDMLPVRIKIKSKSKDLTTDLVEEKANDASSDMQNTLGGAADDTVKKNDMNGPSMPLNAVLQALIGSASNT